MHQLYEKVTARETGLTGLAPAAVAATAHMISSGSGNSSDSHAMAGGSSSMCGYRACRRLSSGVHERALAWTRERRSEAAPAWALGFDGPGSELLGRC
jgi:hypothetical protein